MTGSIGTPAWKHRTQLLATELNRTIALRRELAALEIAHDRRLLQRGAIVGGIAALAIVAGLVLLLQSLALRLADITELNAAAWSLILGATCLLPGILLLLRVYYRIRSSFCGLRGTLAELNEDLVWLREWTADDSAGSVHDGENG